MDAVKRRPEGITAPEIAGALNAALPRRTLQYRLKALVEDRRLARRGTGRWARYRVPRGIDPSVRMMSGEGVGSMDVSRLSVVFALSEAGEDIRARIRRPLTSREPVGYDRDFLASYRPNESFLLSEQERAALLEAGMPGMGEQPAGTYAKRILNRLLIDLSWNSSRLEGNTYSLLETTRLVESGEEVPGRDRRDAQMILNHKDAIEFLVENAEYIGFNRHTILNLHAALADNLLSDPAAPGRLRHIAVAIEGSVFHPLEVPHLIEECFDGILARASQIRDPFEQAFFALVQLPYLQPFDDVNKRVSRLAANIPLIRANLAPLSFEEVPRELYIEAILGVYELRRTELLRDLFVRAYRRSAARYAAVRQSRGEPDPFRLHYRAEKRELVAEVIRAPMDTGAASSHIRAWSGEHVDEPDRERFRDVVERELLSLHDGNFARYRVRPSEFAGWQAIWRGEVPFGSGSG